MQALFSAVPKRRSFWKAPLLSCRENLLSVKQKGYSAKNFDPRLSDTENNLCEIITEDSELHIPEETLAYIRSCLGRNAEGLTNVQMVSRFLNTTDSMLRNDMRYGIPSYMINVPRNIYKAKLYVDNVIFPLITGCPHPPPEESS